MTPEATAAPFPAPLADAVREAFEGCCPAIFKAKAKVLTDAPPPAPGPGVVAIMSVVSDPLWAFTLILPKAVAPVLAKKFAGFDIPFQSRDMVDVVGELANVVAGDIIARLDRRGVKAKMSLPMVASGTDFRLLMPGDVQSKQLTFQLPDGTFWVDVVVANAGHTFFRQAGK